MSTTVFENATLVDATHPEAREGFHVAVEGDRIREVSDRPIRLEGARRLDLRGRTLMPGLIDAHCHVTLSTVNVAALEHVPLTLMSARAATLMKATLDRGFTTIRDTGGADWGLAQAVEDGHFQGPRIFPSGRALSQTGGHGDFRPRTACGTEPCGCSSALHFNMRIADGVAEVRKAAREELRRGATQIKVMVSGGVASPNDPLENRQYSPEELRAIVEEAEAWNTYVLAHAYTAGAIVHAVGCGVRSIEHGNLIDDAAARLMAERDAYLVPTLVTYRMMKEHGRDLGLPEVSLAKLDRVLEAGLRSLEIARRAGGRLGFGTDLLGDLQVHQSLEFLIRGEVESPHAVIASATAVNAELMGQAGRLGVVAEGATADLLVVDGNPLADLSLLQDQGRHLAAIVKGGSFHRNRLDA